MGTLCVSCPATHTRHACCAAANCRHFTHACRTESADASAFLTRQLQESVLVGVEHAVQQLHLVLGHGLAAHRLEGWGSKNAHDSGLGYGRKRGPVEYTCLGHGLAAHGLEGDRRWKKRKAGCRLKKKIALLDMRGLAAPSLAGQATAQARLQVCLWTTRWAAHLIKRQQFSGPHLIHGSPLLACCTIVVNSFLDTAVPLRARSFTVSMIRYMGWQICNT